MSPLARALSLALATLPLAPASVARAETGPLAGRWAFLQVTTSAAEIPVIGKVYATTSAVSIHKLKHKGNRLRGKGRICRIDLDSGSPLVKTAMPEALLASLPAPRIDAQVQEDGGAWRFSQARQTIVLGAKLDAPTTDALPRLLGDPRIIDQDGDGAPAVTIRVSGIVSGELRVVQRSWTELSGRGASSERIEGSLAFGTEQVILDATSSMLKTAPPQAPEPSRSYFRLVKLSKGASCSDALAATRERR
ncbi:MAG: hypothetical protein FJ095_12295 [Deltaproteobacteria bacterium]|nr:hypothetical protein [Deltaproteobacteria bacterium]